MRATVWQNALVHCRMLACSLVLGCLAVRLAEAHKGPPFPLLMDQPAADYSVSVWADPDIGDAYFYIVVETPTGQPPEKPPKISVWTEPISGRLGSATYEATRANLRNRVQFDVRPYFDQGDMWNVGFRVESPDGNVSELIAQVESTPPGLGPWDFAIYLFPFVLLAGMWIVAMVRRMRAAGEIQNDRTKVRSEHSRERPELAAANARDWT